MWEVGFLLLGAVFRVHGLLYEAHLRLDREAVAEERRKIAREVHDLVGHGLGAALLNMSAARLAASRGDRVDIWRDPQGAAAVRAVNEGNETVPTVMVAGRPYTNPDPGWVRRQLR